MNGLDIKAQNSAIYINKINYIGGNYEKENFSNACINACGSYVT